MDGGLLMSAEPKYTVKGKTVRSSDGTTARTKGSRGAAKDTARHLNGLHESKLRGEWSPPKDSYSKWW
jgi:hypothetical protein